MKKFLILIAAAFITVNVNAQWFVGGNVGIKVNALNEDIESSNSKENEFGFMLAPKTGYYFNEKLALGANLNFCYSTYLQHLTNFLSSNGVGSYKSRAHSVNYGIYPFVRYSVFTCKNFSILLEGSVGVEYWQSEQIISGILTDEKTEIKRSVIEIGVLNVTPILGFKLSEHFQLEARLNFLNLGYNIDKETYSFGTAKRTSTQHDLNIGFKSTSMFTAYLLTIGVIYKF